MILGARANPVAGRPWSADPADYPGCAFWFMFSEAPIGNGTVLVDRMGNVLDMAVVQNGTGDADAVYGALSTSGDAGNEVYAQTATLPSLVSAADSLIIELDMTAADSAVDGAAYIEYGDPFNSASRGFALQHVNTTGSMQMVCRNSANSGTVYSTLGSSPNNEGERRHVCLVWDRSTTDPGVLSYYVNGALQFTGALSGAVGSNWIAAGGALRIGRRNGGSRITTIPYYNIRVWALSAIPANIGAVVSQMALNVNEFPPLLAGVS